MLPALLLVVAGLSNSAGRTAVNAFAAGPISEKKTISPMICIGPRGRFNGYFGYDRSRSHGFALGGDEPVTQTESAQAGRMSGMAFRPGS